MLLERTISQLDMGYLPRARALELGQLGYMQWLGGLPGDPEVIAEYVRTYHDERKRLAADAVKGRRKIENRLVATERELARLVDAICDGSAVIQQLEPKMLALQEEQTRLREELEAAPKPLEVISLHPGTLKRYEDQLTDLQTALAKGIR